MKQQELEEFVERLAAAERDAVARIREARGQTQLRLDALRRKLENEQQRTAEAQLKSNEAALRQLESELKTQARAASETTERRIANLRRRQRRIKAALVDWLVEQVSRP
ncbi:hypothetical protein [Motiliproteus sp. SC1-56]|uniref:hypothetical protein n=1 Tax=Motiliproteus sp. SC1-56 TaxID=2799565 RepID=UPI001A8DC090|nr:hypothetical protein [Motiliproteus sp. SC1-56]